MTREKRIGAFEETLASSDKDVVKSLTFVQSDDQSYDPQGWHRLLERK